MRAPSRAVVVAAIVTAAFALSAQEFCPPPAEPVMHWVGQLSGCTAENELPCSFGEMILFSVTPLGGGSYPGCVTYLWNFGDGSTSTAKSPLHVYTEIGTVSVSVRIRSIDDEVFAGKPLVIVAETVLPAIQSFSASATVIRRGQTLVLSWSATNATGFRIDPIGVNLGATATSYSFVPTATRTYQLTAFGGAAFRVSNPVTVVVSEPRRRAVRK